MKDYQAILEPEHTYHIYNRAIGSEQLFLNAANYQFFLERYAKYIQPFVKTYCYCLMPNHFHFLLSVKSERELLNLTGFKNLSGFTRTGSHPNLSGFLSNQFSKFFNSYAKAFNKQQGRHGALFSRPYKRRKITDETYLRRLVVYIHLNPVQAELCLKPEGWKFSSYPALISDQASLLEREEMIQVFEDRDNFIYVHQHPVLTGLKTVDGG